jgi:hypothetical protein
MSEHMFDIEGRCFFCRDVFIAGNEDSRFRTTLVGNGENGIESLLSRFGLNCSTAHSFKRHSQIIIGTVIVHLSLISPSIVCAYHHVI